MPNVNTSTSNPNLTLVTIIAILFKNNFLKLILLEPNIFHVVDQINLIDRNLRPKHHTLPLPDFRNTVPVWFTVNFLQVHLQYLPPKLIPFGPRPSLKFFCTKMITQKICFCCSFSHFFSLPIKQDTLKYIHL